MPPRWTVRLEGTHCVPLFPLGVQGPSPVSAQQKSETSQTSGTIRLLNGPNVKTPQHGAAADGEGAAVTQS